MKSAGISFNFVIHLRPPMADQPSAVTMTMHARNKEFRAPAHIDTGKFSLCVLADRNTWRTGAPSTLRITPEGAFK